MSVSPEASSAIRRGFYSVDTPRHLKDMEYEQLEARVVCMGIQIFNCEPDSLNKLVWLTKHRDDLSQGREPNKIYLRKRVPTIQNPLLHTFPRHCQCCPINLSKVGTGARGGRGRDWQKGERRCSRRRQYLGSGIHSDSTGLRTRNNKLSMGSGNFSTRNSQPAATTATS